MVGMRIIYLAKEDISSSFAIYKGHLVLRLRWESFYEEMSLQEMMSGLA